MILTECENKLLELLWCNGDMTAAELCQEFFGVYGWSVNTTHKLLRASVEKGIIKREDPGFLCIPALTHGKYEIREDDTGLFEEDRFLRAADEFYKRFGMKHKKKFNIDETLELLDYLYELKENKRDN